MNDEIADYKRLQSVGESLLEDSSLETEDGILNVDLYGEAGQLEVEGAPRFLSRMTLTAANSQAGANDRQVANRIATNVPGYFSQGIGDIVYLVKMGLLVGTRYLIQNRQTSF